MRQTIKAYLDAYVETQRSRRRQARHDAEWRRWAERAALAERLGRPDLAQATRQKVLLHGESAVLWGRTATAQAALTEELRRLAQEQR
ncbi:MAG: hypothetical protein OHK0022_24630 [Roseiflexaceae bacterium]